MILPYRSPEALKQAEARLFEEQSLEAYHLLALAQKLAVAFYAAGGYAASADYPFRQSQHPYEQMLWEMAGHAVETLRCCEFDNVLDEYLEAVADGEHEGEEWE